MRRAGCFGRFASRSMRRRSAGYGFSGTSARIAWLENILGVYAMAFLRVKRSYFESSCARPHRQLFTFSFASGTTSRYAHGPHLRAAASQLVRPLLHLALHSLPATPATPPGHVPAVGPRPAGLQLSRCAWKKVVPTRPFDPAMAEPSWHRNARSSRARARSAGRRGALPAGQAALLDQHHGSAVPQATRGTSQVRPSYAQVVSFGGGNESHAQGENVLNLSDHLARGETYWFLSRRVGRRTGWRWCSSNRIYPGAAK